MSNYMLSFDIETTGLDPRRDRITCVSIYTEGVEGKSRSFLFVGQTAEDEARNRRELLDELDAAPKICCFNGVQFDIPFLQFQLRVHPDRVALWLLKTVDLFHKHKTLQGRTFSLDSALLANGLTTKTSNGKEAIAMAAQGRYEELKDYCMTDTVLTYRLSTLPYFKVPEGRVWRK